MKILRSIYNLAERFQFLPALMAATLLGGAFGSESFTWRLGLALLSNFLLYSFAVLYKQIETAPCAAANPDRAPQNPIASGDVTMRSARMLAFLSALLALISAVLLGFLNAAVCVLGILVAISLSHHNLRLGNSALMRLDKYQPVLSALFGLAGFLASAGKLNFIAILLAIFLLAVGILFASLTAQGTAHLLSKTMLVILLAFASGAAYMLFFDLKAIPAWVLLSIMLLAAVLTLLKRHYNPRQHRLPQIAFDSLAISTTVSLIISFLVHTFL